MGRLEMYVIMIMLKPWLPVRSWLYLLSYYIPEYFLEVGVEQQKRHCQGHENLRNTNRARRRGGTNISEGENNPPFALHPSHQQLHAHAFARPPSLKLLLPLISRTKDQRNTQKNVPVREATGMGGQLKHHAPPPFPPHLTSPGLPCRTPGRRPG